jgi:ATP-dependent RNA circularization protein (DNA/RNA ligase family)
MTPFIKFPHTPHLYWLERTPPRADKVMAPAEAEAFLAGDVVVEEKVDGANVGISIDDQGSLRLQGRGQYLGPGAHPQFEPLWAWVQARESLLREGLRNGLVVFGEWCFATHSVKYDRLPDWFLGFDVHDPAAGTFWSSVRRNRLLERLHVAAIPELGRGHFARHEILSLMGASRVGAEPMEGLYLRSEDRSRVLGRAKVVRGDFAQSIDEHWMSQPLRKNRLASRHSFHGGAC